MKLLSCVGAFATVAMLAAGPVSAASALAPQDAMFAMKAAQAGMTEVKLAAVALQKSKAPSVVSFAQQMNADHGKANAQLMSILKQKGTMAPSDVGAENKAAMAKLEAASGPAFDMAYLTSQVAAHKKVLALFKKEAANGSDADLVAFAKQTIPVIASHITMDRHDIAKLSSMGMHSDMPMK